MAPAVPEFPYHPNRFHGDLARTLVNGSLRLSPLQAGCQNAARRGHFAGLAAC